MHIVGVYNTPACTFIKVACSCGRQFDFKRKIPIVVCPDCRKERLFSALRKEFMAKQSAGS